MQHSWFELGRLLPLNDEAPPARCGRWRRLLLPAAALLVGAAAIATPALPDSSGAPPSCSVDGNGWCLARRFPGDVTGGELGFRFGEPLDVDGDGLADVAAGARFKLQQRTLQNGDASVWSGATGALIRSWDGVWPDGLFGHSVTPVPDISGDGLADLVISAPHGGADGHMRGVLVARSPKTGDELWKREESDGENLGWEIALADDADGDGHTDLFVGAPAQDTGRVYLLSGKDGKSLRTYTPREPGGAFGWYVARLDDLDGDKHADLAVGAPWATAADGTTVGAAWAFSSASGKELFHWSGSDRRGGFGNIVTGISDLDGDGKGEIVVTAPATEDQTWQLPGELWVYSGATGKALRHWTGSQPGEQYGRMAVAAGDLDGDGVEDLAIGAPWHARGSAKRVGRIEFRSGRSGAVLGQLFGDGADCWFGWHVRRAPDPEGRGRPALLVASLRHPVDGKVGVGVLDLYVLRGRTGAAGAPGHEKKDSK